MERKTSFEQNHHLIDSSFFSCFLRKNTVSLSPPLYFDNSNSPNTSKTIAVVKKCYTLRSRSSEDSSSIWSWRRMKKEVREHTFILFPSKHYYYLKLFYNNFTPSHFSVVRLGYYVFYLYSVFWFQTLILMM